MTTPTFRAAFNEAVDPAACRALFPPDAAGARDFHRRLAGYEPTPLVELPALAAELGLGRVMLKDESPRYGLRAFKVLGASWAIFRFLEQRWAETHDAPFPADDFFAGRLAEGFGPFTFTAATDGNHGRAVAWTAARLGQRSVIYLPAASTQARKDNIVEAGGELVAVEGTYDDCVARCEADGKAGGWHVISDTAWPGYTEIPTWIMAGYRTMFEEVDEARRARDLPAPDVVFMQAGVGGMAAAGTWYLRENTPDATLVCVEPTTADCLLESVAAGDGAAHKTKGDESSIMAGLNCGTPSMLSWPIIRAGMEYFLAVDDDFAREAMRVLAQPRGGDPAVVSGESGAAGLAGLLALCREPGLADDRRRLGLGPDSTVLLISTEGDTDPAHYAEVVGTPREA